MSLHSLMFGWEYPPFHSGGLGVACHGMVHGLLKHGARITLVLPSNATDDHQQLDVRGPGSDLPSIRYVKSTLQPYEGYEEYAERMKRAAGGISVQNLYGPDLGEAVERFAAMSVDITRDVQADVIHCHDWMTYDAGVRAKQYHNLPLVAHMHATELDRTDFHPNQWIADKERWGLMQANRVIAVSNYTKNLLVNHYGIPSEKIAVVHNGHDLPAGQAGAPRIEHADTVTTQLSSAAPLVLFLGRLTTQKNPWQFLEAAHIVHQYNHAAMFVMAGDGPMLSELMNRACELDLTDRIIFTGKVARNEVDNLFTRASCFVMPSLSEPFGLVALEAIGHHVPIVISRQSGVAEVVEHCFKVDFWDTERFADCILTILREAPLAQQLQIEASHILTRLTWKNQANQILSIYKDLLRL